MSKYCVTLPQEWIFPLKLTNPLVDFLSHCVSCGRHSLSCFSFPKLFIGDTEEDSWEALGLQGD